MLPLLALALLPSLSFAHPTHSDDTPHQRPFDLPLPDLGPATPALEAHFVQQQLAPEFRVPISAENSFGGLYSFGHLQPTRCWGKDRDELFDVAVIGAPFDTGTSWRPGARFGPAGIRAGSQRIRPQSWNPFLDVVASDGQELVDCGDVPMSFTDNAAALDTLTQAYSTLIRREMKNPPTEGKSLAKDGKFHPRIVTLGGDHTILLPILRGIGEVYGPISVLHADSHQDTWRPTDWHDNVAGGAKSKGRGEINHGSMLWHAAQEGWIANGTSVHAGLRSSLRSKEDYDNDDEQGFHRIHAWEMSEPEGAKGIVRRIKDVVGDRPLYVSIDIDVLDPAFAPATGTPEIGGWSTRELKEVIAGLSDMKIVGLDIVEVAPAYDTAAEVTSLAAAGIIYQFLGVFAKTPLVK